MAESKNTKTIAYGFCSVILFAIIIAGMFLFPRQDKEVLKAEIVVFGDSIMGEAREEVSIPERIGNKTGKTSHNAALGGTRMSRMDSEKRMDDNRDGLSFVAMSKAMAAKDFSVQKTVHITEGGTGYFDDAIKATAKVDFEQCEILIVEYGLNDYHNAVALENPGNPYDEYTLLGAMRSGITMLQKTYPNMRIIYVTPTYTWYPSRELTCENYDTGNGYLEKYVNAQIALAKELGIETIDLYHDFYDTKEYENWKLYTRDGIHPNEEGRDLIAQAIADYILSAESK